MRGTPPCEAANGAVIGIIPACAGNTRHTRPPVARHGDHPRVCGEHSAANFSTPEFEGSSPRVRGTLHTPSFPLARTGIIPACAGNTLSSATGYSSQGDHPRVCGEHHYSVSDQGDAGGSSPRVRGTLDCREAAEPETGIIPACAGNTGKRGCCCGFYWDHPRVCGEHYRVLGELFWRPGSSPRVRGTHVGHRPGERAAGIIPACAGNTDTVRTRRKEYGGSSPRVRGTPPSFLFLSLAWGIIPACAGNTIIRSFPRVMGGIIPACAGNTPPILWHRFLMRDHPRVCGEH